MSNFRILKGASKMKKATITLIILVAVMTATASYVLLTSPDPPRNLTGFSGDSAEDGSISVLLENVATLPDCPTDANLGRQAISPIVAASALDSDGEAEEPQEGEEEDGKDKGAEEGRPDRMWGAVKLG